MGIFNYFKTKPNNKSVDLKKLFFEDKKFREDIIFIHYAKSGDYIASRSKSLLEEFNFSKGRDSLLMALIQTIPVKTYSIDNSGAIQFVYETGFMGLKAPVRIINLFPLLIKHCYKPKNVEDLKIMLSNSENGTLLSFLQSLNNEISSAKVNELVDLLNKPESNPNIQEIDFKTNDINKNILILNPFAYENIFKKFITSEIIEPYKKKN